MIKHEIFNAFDQRISLKSIVHRNDEYVIQGKYCVIAPMGKNRWDVWICNSNDLYNGLGQRKVRNIAAKLFESEATGVFTELTGEAYGIVTGTDLILLNLELLGIKKKRVYSPEAIEKMKATLNTHRFKRVPKKAA